MPAKVEKYETRCWVVPITLSSDELCSFDIGNTVPDTLVTHHVAGELLLGLGKASTGSTVQSVDLEYRYTVQ